MSDLVQEAADEPFPASGTPVWNSVHIGSPIQELFEHRAGGESTAVA